MKTVTVELGKRSYQILIASGLLNKTGSLLKELGTSNRIIVITNPTVKGLCGDTLIHSLSQDGFETHVLEVADGEQYKSLDTAAGLYKSLSELYAERGTTIIALGGGVIGDLTGFVAATYQRGVPLIQLPTTLLAQVDSSIGGKVAVNHEQLKNNIGAFYHPKLVISDIGVLKTLTEADFYNGLAEVIKSAVIRDEEFFGFIEANADAIKARESGILEEIVYRSADIKASVVARDETDLGIRSILNFGHTIGHAIETVSHFNIAHGGAVAIGMVSAAAVSNKIGILSDDDFDRLKRLITKFSLPTEISGQRSDEILQAMKHDKKVTGGRIRFVLPKAIGDVFITDKVDLTTLKEVLSG